MRVMTFRTRNLWPWIRGKRNLDSGKFWLRHSLRLTRFLAKRISSHLRRVCNSTYLTASQPRSFHPGAAENDITRRRALAHVFARVVQKVRAALNAAR